MASPRRIGGPDSKNRVVLLDAAEQLMLDEGYAAVSSRRVASKAGLKPQLVHYYFRTMDDLFVAVFRRRAEAGLERQARALASAQPLRAMWEFSTDPAGTALTMEFISLASHRATIRAEISLYAERFRSAQLDAMSRLMERYGIHPDKFPPVALVVLMTSLSRVMVMEEAIDVFAGHKETVALVERYLDDLEGKPQATDTVAPET